MTGDLEHSSTAVSGAGFVAAIRSAAPYVHTYNGRTFVIAFPGEVCLRRDTERLLADIALLCSLGVRVVIVHGARPQIEEQLRIRGIESRFDNGFRITDSCTMEAVKAAVGILRVGIEAKLSSSLANTPMAGSRLKVIGGTWVTARPLGVRNGVDFQYSGTVRSVDIAEIRSHVSKKQVVLISPIGYSPTGEAFNLRNADIAEAVATGLGADKLIFILESEPGRWSESLGAGDSGQLPLTAAERGLTREMRARSLPEEDRNCVMAALSSCRSGVRRVHLIGVDGASPLLRELFTRDGCGLMISAEDDYESLRPATVDDITGIKELIEPMERSGILVARSREQIEVEIATFSVIVRDGTVIACNAFIDYPGEQSAEFACVAVHPDYRGRDLAAVLLRRARSLARGRGYRTLFALTTQTPHWFLEHGFIRGSRADLPRPRREAYDEGRNSIVLVDQL